MNTGIEKAIEVPWKPFPESFYFCKLDEITQMSQPSLSKIPLQMLKPNPIPFGLSEAPLSSFANGLNSLLMSYCLIPMP